jgi:serine/threonine-protein kinase
LTGQAGLRPTTVVKCRVVSIHEDIERRARERVGSVLRGKYQLDSLLGVGGMGAVYAATHKNNRSRVAVKVLHAEQSINAHIRQRFLREGYVANTVDHVGAVRVIDDDTAEDGAVFLVMELLEGETLEARLRRAGGKLPEAEVAEIAVHLLDVLAAAHAKKIVHRDMKPENVFITKANVVKVLDFGIARLREEGAMTSTQTGQTVGTPAFMAPEQALGDPDAVGPETDVWAIGATMFTALSGELVHEDATTPIQMVLKAATKKARSVTTVAPEISRVLATIVDRALAFDRKDRYADAGAMRDALREGLGISIVSSAPNFPRISSPEFTPSSHVSDEALAPTIALPENVVIGTTTAGLSAAGRTSKAPSRARLALPIVLGVVVIGAAFYVLRKPTQEGVRPQPLTTLASTPVETSAPAVSTPAVASTVAPPATSTPAVRSAAPQLRPAHSITKPSASGSASAAPTAKSDPLDRQ